MKNMNSVMSLCLFSFICVCRLRHCQRESSARRGLYVKSLSSYSFSLNIIVVILPTGYFRGQKHQRAVVKHEKYD